MAQKKIDANSAILGARNTWRFGHLQLIDKIPAGDVRVANALSTYANHVDTNRQSRHWIRAVQWIENILFTAGRHYIDDILISRLSRDAASDSISIQSDAIKNIPRPVNDLLGRYIETNIALLTENRPRPRVTPKSNRAEDQDKAELSELTLEYLWEALDLPELHREIARIMLHCGICFLETIYDPTVPRRITVAETETESHTLIRSEDTGEPVELPLKRKVTKMQDGQPVMTDSVEYGDITANVISPFEMHLPVGHWWNKDMDWIMREYYTSVQMLIDQYSPGKKKMKLSKADGWHLDRLDKVGTTNVRNLPIWWWERLSDLVEGPGPSIYVGTPEQWEGYTIVRIFDRKPSPMWPRGRTIMIAGDQVLYDSPKERGARAYDPRWPDRWHPYTRFRWEPMVGSMYSRSLVSKLLPKLKRINAIDTTLIMWRRTVPISTWISPKGSHPVEDIWTGRPGGVIEYDPRRTMGAEPKPVFAPDYPKTILEERAMQITEMESIAGTEEILRGQRPTGTTSAAMIEVLRKQALASRSAILQGWDESLQKEGTILLQEVIKNIGKDPRYLERIRIIANERKSRRTIQQFSGSSLSDNVHVRIDTASMALMSKEAREAKAIEAMQYAQGLMQLPIELRAKILEELGWADGLVPQGVDVDRAQRILALIRQGDLNSIIPYPEDDPYVFHSILTQEMKSDAFTDLSQDQQAMIMGLIDLYQQQIAFKESQQMKLDAMAQEQGRGKSNGGGQQGG